MVGSGQATEINCLSQTKGFIGFIASGVALQTRSVFTRYTELPNTR